MPLLLKGNKKVNKEKDILAVFNRQGICLAATSSWNSFFAHEKEEGQSSIHDFINSINETSPALIRHYFKKCIQESKAVHFTIHSLLNDTTEDKSLCIMEPWFYRGTEVGGVIAIIDPENKFRRQNLSDLNVEEHLATPTNRSKQKIHQLLEKDKDKYSVLIDNMRNIVCLHYPDGRYYYLSPSFEEVLGYSPEEMIGRDPYDFFHPEDIEDIRNLSHKPSLKGNQKNEIEYRFRKKDGTYIWLHSLTRPLYKNGELFALQTDTFTIQDRKELENKLRESEQQFRGAFEHSAIGMAIVGPEGQWLEVNKQICDMLGYTESELTDLTFQDLTHPDDLQDDLDLLKELIEGKRKNYQMEKRYFTKTGEIVWGLLSVSVVRKEDGSPKHFISQITDITKRIKSEKEQQQLHRINKDQKERLMNFAHIVSHNLRSHSSNLKMLLDLLSEETEAEEKEHLINMIDKASDKLEQTIQNLNQDVKRNTHVNLELKEIFLRDAIENAIASIEALILKNYVIVNNHVPSNEKILASPSYLDSILLNLITNAIKYSTEEENPRISFNSKIVNNKVQLSVSDNGKGIDLNKHGGEIFKLHRTFHGNSDAKGIGLFITKNQVEAMDGSIEIESEKGKGTTFIITFKNARS